MFRNFVCASAFYFVVFLALAPQSHAQSASGLQTLTLLPPTIGGSSAPCPAGYNQLLTYNGTNGTDNNGVVSAINCINYGPTVGANGDLWLGSTDFNGQPWTTGKPEMGPRLHISGYTGENSDDMYFQKMSLEKNRSELILSIADDPVQSFAPGQIGDAFVIGVNFNNTFNPHFTFTSTGLLGIGSNTPRAQLDVIGNTSVSGTVTAGAANLGSVSINGTGPLTNQSAKQLLNLQAAPACGANQALTKNADGSFSCLTLASIPGVGNLSVPVCTAAQQLYFNGTSFACRASAGGATPQGCHIVIAQGNQKADANHIADARCAANEYVLSGGGISNQWTGASSLCPGDPAQDRRGFIHTSIPDNDLQGWSVDAYATDGTGEVCTTARAVCCTR